MESLKIRQDIGLIFIVTDEFKSRLLDELASAIDDVQSQIDQFDFRARHALAELQRADLNRAMAARQQIDTEKRRMETLKRELTDRRTEVEKIEIGSEYPRGTVEGLVEVKEGDNIFEKIIGAQLIIKDNIVVEIRQQTLKSDEIILPTLRSAE